MSNFDGEDIAVILVTLAVLIFFGLCVFVGLHFIMKYW